MQERKQRTTAGDKTICLPIGEGIDYEELGNNTAAFRVYLDQQIELVLMGFVFLAKRGFQPHRTLNNSQSGTHLIDKDRFKWTNIYQIP